MGRTAHIAAPHRALGLLVALLLGAVAAGAAPPPELSFEARVEGRRALERVWYEHHLWPEQNVDPKPPFETLYPEADRRAAVEESLRMGRALDLLWQDPVTPDQLQAEMERMARDTKMPDRLAEYWAALAGSPERVAECLVRPQLTRSRLISRYLWEGELHGAQRAVLEAELARARRFGALSALTGALAQREYLREGAVGEPPVRTASPEQLLVVSDRWEALEAGLPGGKDSLAPALGPLVEEADYFEVTAVVARGADRIRTLTWSWPKRSFEAWWEEQRGCFPPELPAAASYRRPAEPLHQLEGWSATSTTGAPQARRYHGAIWTGNQMVVWGGQSASGTWLANGGHYDPATDTWWATGAGAGCPSGRSMYRLAVWTGGYMVVWGNATDASGGRYHPNSGVWSATTGVNAPAARYDHTAVWSGSYVVIWGGIYGTAVTKTGGRYDAASNSWVTMNTASAPLARHNHAAAWDATYGMVAWGGSIDASTTLNTGGQYTSGDGWPGATETAGAPSAREMATGVWRTGVHFIVWGGNSLSPATALNSGGAWLGNAPGAWSATNLTGAPSARTLHSAVWSSALNEMVVWGGYDYTSFLATGARYRPTLATWTALATSGAPSARAAHSAVSADDAVASRMIVWGGGNAAGLTNTGGVYHICSASASLPTLGSTNSTAADADACAFSGVSVTWPKDPASWGDDGYGTRNYQVLRDGATVSALIAYGTTSFVDTGGTPGTPYTYAVIYGNGCGHGVNTAGNAAADLGDTTACPAVGDTLTVGKSGSDAALTWGAVACGDLAGYRVYGASVFDAPFPSGWTALTPDASGTSAADPLGSAFTAYRVVTLDTCLNPSAQ